MPSFKRITNYCNYAIRNCDAGEGFARHKAPISTRCDTIWDIYAGERVAMAKSTTFNRCDTIWNVYVSEGFAPIKSRISNCCDTIWNVYVSEGFATPIQRQISCNIQNDKKLRVNANIYSI